MLCQLSHAPVACSVTSAVESLDDEVLLNTGKGPQPAAISSAHLNSVRNAGLTLQPTFLLFTPWATRENYSHLLEDHRRPRSHLIGSTRSARDSPADSIALASSRTAGYRRRWSAISIPMKLIYPWRHCDPAMDALAENVSLIVAEAEKKRESRFETFERIWEAAAKLQETFPAPSPRSAQAAARSLSQRTLVLLSGAHRGPVVPIQKFGEASNPAKDLFENPFSVIPSLPAGGRRARNRSSHYPSGRN